GGLGGGGRGDAAVVGRFDGTGQLPVAGQQRVAGEVPDVVAAIAVVQLAHGEAVFQQGGVDAVGAADVEDGRGRDSAGPPVFVDEPAEVRFGQFRDDVVEVAQGAEIGARIWLRVDVVERELSGRVSAHASSWSSSRSPRTARPSAERCSGRTRPNSCLVRATLPTTPGRSL